MVDITTIGFKADTSDLKKAEKGLNDVARAGDKADKSSKKVTDEFGRTAKSGDRLAKSNNKVKKSTDSISGGMKNLIRNIGIMAAAYATVRGLTFAFKEAEAFAILDQRIKTATKSTGDYVSVSKALYTTSQKTGTALASNVVLFQQLARAAPEINRTNKDALQLTQTLQQLGTIGGSNSTQMGNAMLQFGQSMAGGIMRAEEFNSIIENTPEVAVRIANGMGKTVGQLRNAVIAGGVLSADVFDSLLKQSEGINAEFEKMPNTMGRSSDALMNSMDKAFAASNEGWGMILGAQGKSVTLTGLIADGMKATSEWIDEGLKKETELESILRLQIEAQDMINEGASIFGNTYIQINKRQEELVVLKERELQIMHNMSKLRRGDVGLNLAEEKNNQNPLIAAKQAEELELTEKLVKQLNKVSATRESILAGMSSINQELQKEVWAVKERLSAAKKLADIKKKAAKAEKDQRARAASTIEDMAFALKQAGEEARIASGEQAKYTALANGATVTEANRIKELALAIYDKTKAVEDGVKAKEKEKEAAKQEAIEQERALDLLQNTTDAVNDYGDTWTRTGDKALDALGSMMAAMSKVDNNEAKYAKNKKKIIDANFENEADRTKALKQNEDLRAKNYVKGSLNMLDASVAMYEEGSAAQEAAHTASVAFHAIQLAMDIEKAISAATVAVATQGEGDPYTAWARIAAMSVMMGGLISQIGGSFGGSSGGGGASYAQINQSDSGVLGGGESNSIQNLSDRLEDVNAGQYEELRAINKNTKFLNESLTSATGALYSTGTIGGLSADLSTAFKDGAVASAIDSMTNLLLPGFFGDIAGGFLSSAAGAIFGGGTKKSSTGYGLNIGGTAGDSTTVGYQGIKKKTDGGWFGSDKTSYYDVTSSVDPQVSSAISKTFGHVGDMLTDFGDTLDRDVSGLVDDLKITTGKIELTGKSSEEIQKALTQAVNVQTDKWAYQLFSGLINTYQKLNESAFDTLSRLAIDKAIVESVITKTGQTIVGDSIALSEALINIAGGLEELTDASKTYYDAFFSEEEKQADLQSSLVSAMAEVNRSLPETSAGYRMLVESLDLSTESGKKAYVTMMKLSGNADDYYTTQLENQQKAFDAQKKLQQDALDSQIGAVNKTISAYERLSSVLSNTFDSIMGTSGTSDSMAYMSAQATLSSALTGARGGKLPELSGIQDALSVVSNNSASSYATIQSYQRDQMTTAGMVDELLGYTNSGLSVQDKMLIELQVQSELLAQKTMDITAPTAASTAATRIAPKPEYTASQIYDQLGVSYTSDFVNYWDRKGITGDALESAMEEAFKAQESSARKDKALAAFALDGSHADGLSYVPRDGYRAELHKGEAVATAKQADFFRSGELIQAISGMKVEVSQLREQVARDNVKIVANTFNAADKLDNWDVVGMPEVRV